jgi:hypothetical protein
MGAREAVLTRWRSFSRRKRHEPIAPAEDPSDHSAATAQTPDSRDRGRYAPSVARRRGLGHSIDLHADGNERADDRITVVQPNGAVLRRGPDDMAPFGVTAPSNAAAEGTNAARPTKVFSGAGDFGFNVEIATDNHVYYGVTTTSWSRMTRRHRHRQIDKETAR